MTEELDVIRQVLAGDSESFWRLVDRNAGPVVRMIRKITVPDDHCFVLGDNRSSSLDSR